MKLLFRLLHSSFVEKLAYLSAIAAALGWVTQARYPVLFPGSLKTSVHIYTAVFAALAGGLLIAKVVFIEGYRRTLLKIQAEKEGLAAIIQRLEGENIKIREERNLISEREAVLQNRLKSFETSEMTLQQSSLRKKIRSYEDDKRMALTFLLHDLRSRLQELEPLEDRDSAQAEAVLKKELQWLENEVKKGERSLYEMVLMINEIRDSLLDLTLLKLQSQGEPEQGPGDQRPPREFHWFASETDPSRLERIYKFLRVAFHPDRFSSEGLKEEAKIHFQEAVQAYRTWKERQRTTH
ncbi:MAG: hypothetical protein HY787_18520 [Deltaproteobacteria bacterium]|nr:hypothetical protein [Deltaproteobacteria bacterium]